jgi:16S rRNA (guanine(966)-N(2))-methyltransferase RsmD
VRIIGGQFKRSKLKVLDKPGLRPTPDRVRETLFNWLGQDLRGWHCLDAFAGTGALGFEAASRGAQSVVLVEADAQVVACLKASQARLQATVDVRRGDGVAELARCPAASLDLIFLDPPFSGPWFEPALTAAHRALRASGYVYLEAPQAWPEARLAESGWVLQRHLRAGQVHAHLLRKRPLAAQPETVQQSPDA